MIDQLWYLPWIIGGSTVGMILFSFGIVLFVMALVRRGEARRQALLASGEPADATVISTGYTGVRVNRRRQIATQLEVRRGGQPPYRATDRYYLDGQIFSSTPLYLPGAAVQVRVDPQDPRRVAIVGLADGMPDIFEQAAGPLVSPSERLAELKRMLDQSLISAQEYETKRAEILRQM